MRRVAILVTSLVAFTFAGCNLYFDDDDRNNGNHPQSGEPDGGPCCGAPDAGCGGGPGGHPDGGFWPDGGTWPDGGFWPDAGTGGYPDAGPGW